MSKDYINVMLDTTKKKLSLLIELYDLSLIQSEIIKKDFVEWDEFDENVDKKDEIVDKINSLDEGFETLYQRVKEDLENNKESYTKEINELKELIKSITEKSVDIKALEMHNKTQIEQKFNEARQQIKKSKMGTEAAAKYYQKVNKLNVVDPQLMDKKS